MEESLCFASFLLTLHFNFVYLCLISTGPVPDSGSTNARTVKEIPSHPLSLNLSIPLPGSNHRCHVLVYPSYRKYAKCICLVFLFLPFVIQNNGRFNLRPSWMSEVQLESLCVCLSPSLSLSACILSLLLPPWASLLSPLTSHGGNLVAPRLSPPQWSRSKNEGSLLFP